MLVRVRGQWSAKNGVELGAWWMGANTACLALGKDAAPPNCLYPTLLLITGGGKIPRQEAFRLHFHSLCFCPGGLGVPALLPFSQGLGLTEGLSSTAMTLLFFFACFPCSGVRGGLFQPQIGTWSATLQQPHGKAHFPFTEMGCSGREVV